MFGDNIDYYICLFASLLLNAILFSIICLFVKEKVQWILGSILGSVISAVLLTIFVFFVVVPSLEFVDPPAPVYVPVD